MVEEEKDIYNILMSKDKVLIEFINHEKNEPIIVSLNITTFPVHETIKRLGLVYFSILILSGMATYLFFKRKSLFNRLGAFVIMCLSLNLTCSAPLIYRDITLHPVLFRLLMNIKFVFGMAVVAGAHLALVFPERKKIIIKYPIIIKMIYIYIFTTSILYVARIMAFGTPILFGIFWGLVTIGGFLHSCIAEEDILLRKQMHVALFLPLILTLVYILFIIPPKPWGLPRIEFSAFSLFSIVFATSFYYAIENYYLYQENIEKELIFQREREKIIEEIHDNLGHDLVKMKLSSEVAHKYISEDMDKVEQNIKYIKDISKNCLEQMRNFLWVIDIRSNTWEELIGYFREITEKAFTPNGIDLEWQSYVNNKMATISNLSLKFNLYRIYKENITNILKHSRAKKVKVNIILDLNKLEINIEDDGIGFDFEEAIKKKTYGLNVIIKRAEEIGTTIKFDSQKEKGTRVYFIFPFAV